MIDVLNETLIDPRKVCELQPFRNRRTGKPAHWSKVYRCIAVGAKDANGDRVRLETCRTPSGLATSLEAVERFIAALTDPEGAAEPAARTPSRRRAEHRKAVEALKEAGWSATGKELATV